tara:strand:+ start:165 stop:2141 length:1977 start_codon:yes stop_codon:yes gene_type:complete
MMRAPSFHSDPHVQFLSQLLEEIGDGGMQVPRFQRPLVWGWERRLELLRSIRDGIPIGAIMVWRTSTVRIDCYENLGPHKLVEPAENATRQYILDGVQRLSTLYGALHRPPITSTADHGPLFDDLSARDGEDFSGETGPFDVFFNPKTGDFVSPELLGSVRGPVMPIHLAFDSVALLRYQRSLADAGDESLIKATDQLARAFRDYKIPVIPITTDDINLATRTFQRINSQGAGMTEAHMVHALTWKPSFDLQSQLLEQKERVLAEVGWGALDDDPILKACKASFGLDVYKTNAQEFSEALLSSPETLDEVFAALSRTARFLWVRCGVPSPDLVPYALQIVVLAEAFRIEPNPSEEVIDMLFAWFWMTTYGELFAGMSGDRVQLAISDIHATVLDGRPKWTWKRPFEERPLRRTFDFRAARAKAFAFRLAATQDQVYGNSQGTRLLADAGRRAFLQMIPWSRDRKDVYSSPGNRFLIAPNELQVFRERFLAGLLTEKERLAHVVSDAASTALENGDPLEFVRRRSDDIAQLERAFLTPLVNQFRRVDDSIPTDENLISRALENPYATVISSNGRDRFTIKIGDLSTPVHIALRKDAEFWWFKTSHAIHTPLQAGPYWTSRPYDDDAGYALRRAITGLTDYYRDAIDHDLKPSEGWLVAG